MKYSKSIIFLMSINIIIAFILIFIGRETRNIEMSNDNLKHKIQEIKQEININQIEFTLHNDNKYLKKLFVIYHPHIQKKNTLNIIKLSDLSNIKNKEILKVDFK